MVHNYLMDMELSAGSYTRARGHTIIPAGMIMGGLRWCVLSVLIDRWSRPYSRDSYDQVDGELRPRIRPRRLDTDALRAVFIVVICLFAGLGVALFIGWLGGLL